MKDTMVGQAKTAEVTDNMDKQENLTEVGNMSSTKTVRLRELAKPKGKSRSLDVLNTQ